MVQRFPDAWLERVEDSYALVPEDQPQRLTELIGTFVDETRTDGRGWTIGDEASMGAAIRQ